MRWLVRQFFYLGKNRYQRGRLYRRQQRGNFSANAGLLTHCYDVTMTHCYDVSMTHYAFRCTILRWPLFAPILLLIRIKFSSGMTTWRRFTTKVWLIFYDSSIMSHDIHVSNDICIVYIVNFIQAVYHLYSARFAKSSPLTAHEWQFWLGDLNYRIDLDRSEAKVGYLMFFFNFMLTLLRLW